VHKDIVKVACFIYISKYAKKKMFEKLFSALQKTCSVLFTKTRRLNISLEAIDVFLRTILRVYCLNLRVV